MALTSLPRQPVSGEAGFTLIEMMVALLVLMIVSGTVFKGVMDMGTQVGTITNRTDMHASVRNVTELMTQEVGQAGRVALPGPVTLAAATAALSTAPTVSSSAGMFVGEQLLFDAGASAETVSITAIAGNTLTTTSFELAHAIGAS